MAPGHPERPMPRFAKYSGAGNDFVLVRAEEVGLADPGALAARLCPRETGVGVDGLVLVRALSDALVRVRFFNPDGSEFSTCGNGTRCAALYAVDRGLVSGNRLTVVTDAGEIEARVDGGRVRLAYPRRALDAGVEREVEAEVQGRTRAAWLVRIGTPHLVVPLERLPEEGFETEARRLRQDPRLGPEGANVDFVAPVGSDVAAIRTFERGVEGETAACGSGAMAAALVLRSLGLAGESVELRTRSGASLRVQLGDEEIQLEGPARFLFDGVFPDRPPGEG